MMIRNERIAPKTRNERIAKKKERNSAYNIENKA